VAANRGGGRSVRVEREGLKGGREGSRHFLARMEAEPNECRGDWFLRARDNRLVYIGPVGEDLARRLNCITERVRAGTVTLNDTSFPPEPRSAGHG
jgi:hypothetical protein